MIIKSSIFAFAAIGMGFAHGVALACNKPATTVFSCLTEQGKRIQVCDAGSTIDYSFGRPGATPEIVVRARRADAWTYQWRGYSVHYAVFVPNDKTVYRVKWGVVRQEGVEHEPIEAGVDVLISGKHAATLLCASEKPIVQNMEGINLRRTD